MKTGDIVEIIGGAWKCKYQVTYSGRDAYHLKRVKVPKTKADRNRFALTISMVITGNAMPEKESIK